jgi:hypothetical protein
VKYCTRVLSLRSPLCSSFFGVSVRQCQRPFLHATRRPPESTLEKVAHDQTRPPAFVSLKKLNSVICAWDQQIRLHINFARSLRGRARSPISLHAKLVVSLASFLSLVVAAGRSLSQLNLDATQESFVTRTQDSSRGRRQHVRGDPDVYVRNPRTYMRTSEQTVFPGDHTGIARYDTAQLDSTPYVQYATSYNLPCAI